MPWVGHAGERLQRQPELLGVGGEEVVTQPAGELELLTHLDRLDQRLHVGRLGSRHRRPDRAAGGGIEDAAQGHQSVEARVCRPAPAHQCTERVPDEAVAFDADVGALADAVGVERYGFVGYSFGALVGLAAAAADPRVEGLVALGCVFDPPGRPPDPAGDTGYAEASDMRALVEAIEVGEELELPGWLRDDFLATDSEQFRLTLEALAGVPDPWHLLPGITSPAILIAGEHEDPDRTLPRMAELLPNADSVHLPGCGHVGAFLRADEVVSAAMPVLAG